MKSKTVDMDYSLILTNTYNIASINFTIKVHQNFVFKLWETKLGN